LKKKQIVEYTNRYEIYIGEDLKIERERENNVSQRLENGLVEGTKDFKDDREYILDQLYYYHIHCCLMTEMI